ncbi:hypothetical protein HID58_006087 [Brassica napus]|uniref:Peptidase M24 domain-containing protein n=2 Tax=Brassica TaxID=3705 RepID=M4CVN7_BRACM|nr:hypothetical protein HID58_006087 [Brassica napus]CAF2140426.1 unnamed protein product [Brassica napus]
MPRRKFVQPEADTCPGRQNAWFHLFYTVVGFVHVLCVWAVEFKTVRPDRIDGASNPNTAADKKRSKKTQQTDPPTIHVVKLFPSGEFPEGEIHQYKDDNLWRTTSEEKRDLERLEKLIYNSVRQTAEVHRQVREYVRSIAKPGMLMTDICETLEDTVRKLISENSQLVLVGFNFIFLSTIHYSSLLPMFICDGFLTSRVAAHWIPNSGDNTVLPYDDVMKVDFGTHIDGMTANFSFVSPLYKSHLEINISWVFAV